MCGTDHEEVHGIEPSRVSGDGAPPCPRINHAAAIHRNRMYAHDHYCTDTNPISLLNMSAQLFLCVP